MVYLYLPSHISRERICTIVSVHFSLSTNVNREIEGMKIFAVIAVLIAIRFCNGQTNPIAWSRDQRVGQVESTMTTIT